MEKIRTAIIGCGKVAATHAKAYTALPDSQLVAVCDVKSEYAKKLGADYSVPVYSDVEKMIRDADVQAVSVCTPHPQHAEMICRAASAGVHVICEKPLASSLSDCDRAIAACDQANVKLAIISQRRLYWPVTRMIRAIETGKIGRPILGTMEVMGWRSPEYYQMDSWRGKWKDEGGGVMVNQTPHQLDLLCWMMGDVEELYGYWDNFNHPEIEVEDTAMAVIRFKNGGMGQFFVSNSQKPGLWGKIHIFGENGAAIGAQIEGGSSFISGVTTEVEAPYNDLWTIPGDEKELEQWREADREMAKSHNPLFHFHELQIADFLEAILKDRKPLVDGRDGRKTVELFTAVYRCQRDHLPIKFPLVAEDGDDFDGRFLYQPYSRR